MASILRFLIIICVNIVLGQSQWHIETVEAMQEPNRASKSYIVLDSANNPYIAYIRFNFYFPDPANVCYARKEAGNWTTSNTASDAYPADYLEVTALCLALDSQNYPYITYTTGFESTQRLKLVYYNGSSYDTMGIDGPHITKAAIVLDTLNMLKVGYQYNNLYQKFASYDGHYWSYDSIGAGGFYSGKVSLWLDSDGYYHYAYDYYNGNLLVGYAYGAPSNWLSSIVDTGRWPSMKLDANNLTHITYRNPVDPGGKLWYAFFDGTNWIKTLVDTNNLRLLAPSIDIDNSGHVHIAYLQERSADYQLKYAYYDGLMWQFELIDSGLAWHVPSLAVTGDGSAHISYFKKGVSLFHAYRDPIDISEWPKTKARPNRLVSLPNPFVSFAIVPGFEQENFVVYDVRGAQVGKYQGNHIGVDLNPGVYFIRSEDIRNVFIKIMKAPGQR